MKTHGVNRCLAAATLSLLMTLPLGAAAQEEERQNEEQARPEAIRRLFVSDKLVLNVYAQADQASARVATIETGDVVEELERAGNLVRVRLQDGREGWVGASYLTSDAPAATRLRELQREQKLAIQAAEKKSAEEAARLKKEAAALQAQLNALRSPPTAAPATSGGNTVSASAGSAPEAPESQEPKLIAGAPMDTGGRFWMWPLILMLAASLGFAAGYRTLASRIRKKYGGLRIY